MKGALAARCARRLLFPNHLFADPAWDILLALYAATLQEQECGLDCLSATGFTTKLLLCWIDALEREGLVSSIAAERAPRFRLTVSGLSRMECFFSRPIDTSHC